MEFVSDPIARITQFHSTRKTHPLHIQIKVIKSSKTKSGRDFYSEFECTEVCLITSTRDRVISSRGKRVMTTRDRDRNRDLLIPVVSETGRSKPPSPSSSIIPAIVAPPHHHSGREAIAKVVRSWASKKFMTGCVILLPMAITFCITWGFINFVDGFFSPIYSHLGINIFGLGFVTSITFIFLVGVFMSSWLGASVLTLGELFIKKMPLVSYIYAASKQISAAISPDQSSNAFKEVAIIKHPRVGEYALGFITSNVVLQTSEGEEELSCVYVPTNHLYLGDIFLIISKDVIRPNLSVREGIEIVISGGMSIPQVLTTADSQRIPEARLAKLSAFKV